MTEYMIVNNSVINVTYIVFFKSQFEKSQTKLQIKTMVYYLLLSLIVWESCHYTKKQKPK